MEPIKAANLTGHPPTHGPSSANPVGTVCPFHTRGDRLGSPPSSQPHYNCNAWV
jgi:hypothetical protein